MRSRTLNLLTMSVVMTAAASCQSTETTIANLSGGADTLVVAGRTDNVVLNNPDTTFSVPDTVFINSVDTIIPPDDTVLITRIDTILSETGDTTLVAVVDTLIRVDTFVVSYVDTLVSVDTVVVADTVRVERTLVAAQGSNTLSSGLSIDSGKTATLTITAQSSLDVPTVPAQVTWLSDAPGIASVTGTTSTGAVKGVRPGMANIFAIASGLSVAVPTTVNRVQSAPPPPSPPPPTPEGSTSLYFRAHEPSGMTQITNRGFETLSAGWRIDFDGNPEAIVSENGPHSPSAAIQFLFPAGAHNGDAGNHAALLWPSKRIVYMYLTWKISSNWQGHSSGTNKMIYFKVDNPTTGGGNQLIFDAHGVGSGALHIRMQAQQHCCGSNSPIYDPNVGDGSLIRNRWYELEFLFTYNTPGVRDGRLEVWKNGAKVMDHRDWGPLDPGEGPGSPGIWWSPIWGGTGDTVQEDMYVWVDHMYVSGKN